LNVIPHYRPDNSEENADAKPNKLNYAKLGIVQSFHQLHAPAYIRSFFRVDAKMLMALFRYPLKPHWSFVSVVWVVKVMDKKVLAHRCFN
jgi:hypothetical protein